jgi:bifunctional non-homologous end joining protein LigD
MSEDGQEIEVGGRTIAVKNLDKPLFPAKGKLPEVSKGAVIDYYRRVAETMLPHLQGRPVSLQRCPDGIEDCFFQKDVPDYFPDWIARAELPAENKSVHYLRVEDAATLVYIANQGAIALHVGLAPVDKPQHPDRLIFDLDPSTDDFSQVRWAAGVLRGAFEEMEMPSFVMTTGSRGLHVVVPLDRSADFEATRTFGRDMAARLAKRHPERLTVEQRKDKRGGRIFLDVLRNAYGQTAVAPYSLRTKPGAPVATPLDWDEVDGDLHPDGWSPRNLFRRLSQKNDPWSGMQRRAVKLDAKRLDRLG